MVSFPQSVIPRAPCFPLALSLLASYLYHLGPLQPSFILTQSYFSHYVPATMVISFQNTPLVSSPGSGEFGFCDSFVFNKDHLCEFLPNLGFLYTLRVACVRKRRHGKKSNFNWTQEAKIWIMNGNDTNHFSFDVYV